ncbi:MAG: hypothetical protein M3R24_07795 [Chloroflexota bacterium]|nr:hypothetical protein [Chloroflexota bacterium]
MERIEKLISIIASISAGLLIALWYLGRRYAGGFFGALNIPVSLISLSTWDYAESGGQILLLSLIPLSVLLLCAGVLDVLVKRAAQFRKIHIVDAGKSWITWTITGAVGLFGTISLFQPLSLSSIVFWYPSVFWMLVLMESWQPATQVAEHTATRQRSWGQLLMATALSILLTMGIFLAVLIAVEQLAIRTGQQRGRDVALNEAPPARLLATERLPVTLPHSITVMGNTTIYVYDGVYFVTANNGRTFFFRCLNSDEQPEPMYIIETAQVHALEVRGVKASGRACISSTSSPGLVNSTLTP